MKSGTSKEKRADIQFTKVAEAREYRETLTLKKQNLKVESEIHQIPIRQHIGQYCNSEQITIL
jgi:hypothetical protein